MSSTLDFGEQPGDSSRAENPQETPLTHGSAESRAASYNEEPLEDSQEESLSLTLHLIEPELIAPLMAAPTSRDRHDLAVRALRIGMLALEQAQGRLDSETLRNEGENMVQSLRLALQHHQDNLSKQLAGSLQEYFDPNNGRFNERVERLVRQDGELEQLMRRSIGNDDSELRQTMQQFVGKESPLMQRLSPDTSDSILGAMAQEVEQQLQDQRERILREFSLDQKDGALSRLVDELSERHGKISLAMEGQLKDVVEEFSLDNDSSALSRLVKRVEVAQQSIRDEFSLDAESSALARMKRELVEIFKNQEQQNTTFQQEVRTALATLQTRREEAERSTRHGDEFEAELLRFLQQRGQQRGDIVTPTGNQTGRIRNCKVGDCVIELGPEEAAAGARIVIEAKESKQVTLAKALQEIEIGRKNRAAAVGIFVYSAKSAPEGLASLQRFGSDIVTVWDSEDLQSDLTLETALSLARALSTRAAGTSNDGIDWAELDRAIRTMEKQLKGLEDVRQYTSTIQSSNDKIQDRVRIMERTLRKEIDALDQQFVEIRRKMDTSQD